MLAGGNNAKNLSSEEGVIAYQDKALPEIDLSAIPLQEGDKVVFVGNDENLRAALSTRNNGGIGEIVDSIATGSSKETTLATGIQYGYGSNFGVVGAPARAYQYAKEHPKRVGIGAAILVGAIATAALVHGFVDKKEDHVPISPSPTASASFSPSIVPTSKPSPDAMVFPSTRTSVPHSLEIVPTIPKDTIDKVAEKARVTAKNATEAGSVVKDETGARYVYVTKWDKNKSNEPGSLYNIAGMQLRNVPDYEKLPSDVRQNLQAAYTRSIQGLNPAVEKFVYVGNKIRVRSQDEVNDFVATYLSKYKTSDYETVKEMKSKSPNKDTYKTGYENIGRLVIDQTERGPSYRLTAWPDKFSTDWGVADSYLSTRYARESTDQETEAYTQRLLRYNDETWASARNDQVGEQHLLLPADQEAVFFKTYSVDTSVQKNPYDFLTQPDNFMKWAGEHPTANPYAGMATITP